MWGRHIFVPLSPPVKQVCRLRGKRIGKAQYWRPKRTQPNHLPEKTVLSPAWVYNCREGHSQTVSIILWNLWLARPYCVPWDCSTCDSVFKPHRSEQAECYFVLSKRAPLCHPPLHTSSNQNHPRRDASKDTFSLKASKVNGVGKPFPKEGILESIQTIRQSIPKWVSFSICFSMRSSALASPRRHALQWNG